MWLIPSVTLYRYYYRVMDTLIDVKLSVMVVSEPRKSGTIVFIRNKTNVDWTTSKSSGILAMDLKVI